ncbi:MAG TPA: ATP-binding protein [Candidatus Anaerobutyricum stercoripullorum]|uniref:ATP-binding protein n=1 Tax=Candidatus Anaerobutyricum stercoripullorum TaxID=2838456 RepID=A0A9D1X4E2_9FIRM|nr:ATP-binding protein [Candidatus Anaerobutyricum stercoripullorum]
MYREVSKLILYRNLGEDSILRRLSEIFKRFDSCHYRSEELITDIYREIKKLLDLATTYGFDKNLWHNYLTFVLITNENSFSLTSEKVGANDGTVNHFAKNDFQAFMNLFHYDFRPIEETLAIDCFSTLLHYKAVVKQERMYNKNVSEKVRALSDVLAAAEDVDQFFDAVTGFYKEYGVGMFGLNKAFRIVERDEGMPDLVPINNLDKVVLDDLTGYEIQKKKLIDNTEAFVSGRTANNCLLFGDAGTGKSTSIKAILNEYYDRGLRMIEIYKHQFKYLSQIISHVKNRNYRFIIYMDDLSFEEFEIEYKYLKAVIEGGMETRPDNVLIYATSNRRHLIRETWNDRSDMDEEMHRSDTMQEKLSLVYRFGITINFSKPSQKEYFDIVRNLARKYPQITLSDEELCAQANKWELSHGGISGRTAQQFINYLAGQM